MFITVITFIIILTILVLVHELGHFLVAKRFGIKVEEFGLGFPPRLFGIKKGETIYSINWVLFGGFVKLYGEDQPNVKVKNRSFAHKIWWQRALVVLAGVVMNFILAALIFYVTLGINNFTFETQLIFDHNFHFVHQEKKTEILIGSVAANSPAQISGIKPKSELLLLDGKEFGQSALDLKSYVDQRRGKEIKMTLLDLTTNEKYQVSVVPRANPPPNEGALGIGFADFTVSRLSYDTPLMKIFSGFSHAINMSHYNIKVLGKLIGLSIEKGTAQPISSQVTGPIGIGSLVGKALAINELKERILTLLNMAALISLSLAIINVLPFPALDGGRLFFILIEGLTGRKIHPTIERHINTIGFIILISLMVVVTYRDLLRFVFIK